MFKDLKKKKSIIQKAKSTVVILSSVQGGDNCLLWHQRLKTGLQGGEKLTVSTTAYDFASNAITLHTPSQDQSHRCVNKQNWEIQTSRFYLFTIPYGRQLSQHPFRAITFHTQFSAAGGEKNCKPSIIYPAYMISLYAKCWMQSWLCCPDLNVHSAGTFHRGFHVLSELPRSRRARAGVGCSLLSARQVFFFCCMPRTAIQPKGWGSLGVGGA